jgi:hypothetical protein
VLAGDDVIDGERKEGILVLVDATVLAGIARALTDVLSQSRVHQAERSCRSLRAFD